jgi:hypothetical protein
LIEHEADRMDMYRAAAARIEQRSAPEPTPERTPPARETSGQFRSNEPAYGREAEERAAGYKPLKDDRDEPEGLTVRDAANEIAKARQEKPIEVHESGLDEKITLRVEQAAERVGARHRSEASRTVRPIHRARPGAAGRIPGPHIRDGMQNRQHPRRTVKCQ